MARDCDVIIVGGGLNGPLLALALAQGGLTSVVLDAHSSEARAEPGFDGRSYALALASRRLLAALGLWDGLAARAQPIKAIKISDGRPSEGASRHFLHFDGQEIDEGPMGHILEDRYLRAGLLAAIDAAPLVTHRPSSPVVGQENSPGAASVTLADGTALRGALLVACDGRESRVARRAGIRRHGWDYRQTSLVAAVVHERPHGGVAHQFFMPSGPLAILPLPGDIGRRLYGLRRAARAEAIAETRRLGISCRASAKVRGHSSARSEIGGGPLQLPAWTFSGGNVVVEAAASAGGGCRARHPSACRAGTEPRVAATWPTLAEVLVSGATPRTRTLAQRTCSGPYARWRRSDIAALADGDRGPEPALFQR